MSSRKTSLRRIGAVFVLAVLLTSAVFVGFVGMGGAQTGSVSDAQPSTKKYIQVSGSGSVSAQPDKTVIRLAVEATADSPSKARTQVANKVSRMRSALSGIGISDSQIRTVEFEIHQKRDELRRVPQQGAPSEKKSEAKYVASHEFRVEMNGTDRVGNVIDTAVNNGATRVSKVQFTLTEESRERVRSEALKEALRTARSQADTIAENTGLRISGVRSVSTSDVGFSSPVFDATALKSSGASAETVVASGPVEVNANVNVYYDVSG
ncbi:MAG: SIMPL domain-containing protein [Halobacteria archaeon]|nr:SIMPL domain-containing protein [Halobacteria archaeon]